MLEEALKVFNLEEVVTILELDKRYNELIRWNYEENYPFNQEVGSMNVRLYEWSYQVILPFSMALDLKTKDVDLDTLKVLCLLKRLNISYDKAINDYNFDKVLGYDKSFLDWVLNELVKREIIPVSAIDKDIFDNYCSLVETRKALKRAK